MRQGLLGFFGRYPLDQIDFLLVRRYEAKVLARGVKTRGHVNLIRSVLRAAVELRILPKFPDVPTERPQADVCPPDEARRRTEIAWSAPTEMMRPKQGANGTDPRRD
jgi:hypothetical protein